MASKKIRIKTVDGKVEFRPQFQYIRRNVPFEIVVAANEWDGSVDEIVFNNFRSYRFNSQTKNWNKTHDTLLGPAGAPGIVINGPTASPGNRKETFPASAGQYNTAGWEHRLIEFDLTVTPHGGQPVTVDPAWDEKP